MCACGMHEGGPQRRPVSCIALLGSCPRKEGLKVVEELRWRALAASETPRSCKGNVAKASTNVLRVQQRCVETENRSKKVAGIEGGIDQRVAFQLL